MRLSARVSTVSCLLFLITATTAALAQERTHDIDVEDYFSLGVISEVAVSPTGQIAAYSELRWNPPEEKRNTDLWLTPTQGGVGEVRRLTFDPASDHAPAWSPDGRHLYFLSNRKRAGEEKPPHDGSTQVWRIAIDGGEPRPVTRVKDGVGAFELSTDGKTLYYTRSTDTQDDEWADLKGKYSEIEYGHGSAEHAQIWTLDLVNWRDEKLIDEKRTIGEFDVSPDGKRIAMLTAPDTHLISNEGWSRVDVYDVAKKGVVTVPDDLWRAQAASPHGWLEGLAWASDSQALAFSCSWDGYPTEIYVAEFAEGTPNVWTIKRPEGTANGGGLNLRWRGTTRNLCYTSEWHARGYVYQTNNVKAGGQGDTKKLVSGDKVASSYGLSADGAVMVALMGDVDSTPDLFSVTQPRDGTYQYRRLTRINPQVDAWKLPKIEIVQWTAPDGTPVEGILETPHDYDGKKPLPMVVEIHGGPTASTQMNLRFWIYGRTLLASKGYAVLSPNYRGSTGYGDKFMVDLIGRENDIEVKDILAGVDAMVKRGVADPDRLGVMGWSNGGFLTNALITSTTRFKAASSGAGVLDMVIQWGEEDTPGHVINYMQGLPWEKPEAYRKGSPTYGLGKVTTPTIIHVGGNDPRVPPSHSRTLYRALKYYVKVPTELLVYPGEPHGLTTFSNRKAKMEWDLAWFDKYILGKGEKKDDDGDKGS
jgi:dipeptidyl aminopeptidase/acylaminoacyl peptidase